MFEIYQALHQKISKENLFLFLLGQLNERKQIDLHFILLLSRTS